MDPAALTKILLDCQHHVESVQKPAEQQLLQFEEKDISLYFSALCGQIATESIDFKARLMAIIRVKNGIVSNDTNVQKKYATRWLSLNGNLREEIKNLILNMMQNSALQIRNVANAIIAGIAIIELPLNLWDGIIGILVNAILNPDVAVFLKQSSFVVLGDICQHLNDAKLLEQSNSILNAINTGINMSDMSVKLSAVRCLTSCLKFCQNNFEIPQERALIMQMVQTALTNSSEEVMEATWECLGEIADLYLVMLDEYMVFLYEMSIAAMKSTSEKVAMMAMEFWSVVATNEIMILEHLSDCKEDGVEPEPGMVAKNYCQAAIGNLIPVLVECLGKQEEDANDDTRNVSTTAGMCLSLIAQCVGKDIFRHVIPHIDFTKPDWHERDAHLTAYGCVLSAGDVDSILGDILGRLPLILQLLKDPQDHVRDTAAWVLSEICLYARDMFVRNDEVMRHTMTACVDALNGRPRTVINICKSLYNLASQDSDDTAFLAPYLKYLIERLLSISENPQNGPVLMHSYEAISELIKVSPDSLHDDMLMLVPVLGNRLNLTLAGAGGSGEFLGQAQALICCSLESIISNVMTRPDASKELCDSLFHAFIRVFHTDAGAEDEALLCTLAMIRLLKEDILVYLNDLLPLILSRIVGPTSISTIKTAITTISELMFVCATKLPVESCDLIVEKLLTLMRLPEVDRSVKPAAIECLGDVAVTLGKQFQRYLKPVIDICNEAAQVAIPPHDTSAIDIDTLEYLSTLQSTILTCYSCVLVGFHTDDAASLLAQYMNFILDFLKNLAQCSELTNTNLASMLQLTYDIICFASEIDKEFPAYLSKLPHMTIIVERGIKGRKTSIVKTTTQIKAALKK